MIRFPGACVLLALAAGLTRPAAAQQNPHGTLPPGLECGDCHTPKSWKPDPATVKFDHNRQTGFKLVGRHRDVACRSCHLSVKFDEATLKGADCATCHADVHRGAYAERCASCHTTVSFADVPGLQIHARTTFPLTGAHAQITCRTCHVDDRGGAFAPVDPQCISCHRADYERASPVNHVAANYPTDCTRCHITVAWPAHVSFDHVSLSNGFRLLGAHARVRCTSCHAAADMTPLFHPANDQDCVTCHQPDYDRAHPGNSFPTVCANCHTVEAWGGATFDHAQVANGFRLQGAHASLACSQCHAADMTPLFHPTNDQDCISCHQPDYQAAPNHVARSYSQTCLQCHTQTTWEGATFAHTPSMTDCASCHHDDFIAASSPVNHTTQGIIEAACSQCHSNSASSWQQTTYVHGDCYNNTTNRAHQNARCEQCHATGYPAATCTACHQNRASCRD